MIIIEVDLLMNQFGGCPWLSSMNEGKTEIIPSPLRIIRAILGGMYNSSFCKYKKVDYLCDQQKQLILKLAGIEPEYYLPHYTHTGNVSYFPDYLTGFRDVVIDGKESGGSRRISFNANIDFNDDESSIFIFYKAHLTAGERQILRDAFEFLTYLGRSEFPAQWRLLRSSKVKPNCFPAGSGEVVEMVKSDCDDLIHHLSMSPQQSKEEGYRLPPCLRIGYYKVNAVRDTERPEETLHCGQEALLAIDPKYQIPAHKHLSMTNVLHKALCSKCVSNSQAIGKYEDGSFVEQDKALNYFCVTTGDEGFVCAIKVLCKSKIDDDIIIALKRLRELSLDGSFYPVRLMGVSKFYPNKSRNFRSATPALLPSEPRKAIHRHPESIFINHINFQLGCIDKIKDFTIDDDGYYCAQLDGLNGWIRCKAFPVNNHQVPIRGARVAASSVGYFVSIELEKPHSFLSLGAHYRFGSGRLETF